MSRQPSRPTPRIPAQHVRTFQIAAPRSTHWRSASCAEVDCPNLEHGWRTTVDEGTDRGQQQAYYIRHQSGRRFTEHRDPAGLTVFDFEAGQRCFTQHETPIGRPELFLVRDGDWRGNPRGTAPEQHRPEIWVERFAENLDSIANHINKG